MKNNNKGFTLIEVLGVVVILGILATIAVVGTTKYLRQSREKAYRMLSQSAYEATQNCQIQGKCAADGVNLRDLVAMGFLKKLNNPISSKEDCTGNVWVKHDTSLGNEYQKNEYTVYLICPGYKTDKITWPN